MEEIVLNSPFQLLGRELIGVTHVTGEGETATIP